jgi:hypothetical protein
MPLLDIKYPETNDEGIAFVTQIKEFLTGLGSEKNE